ncbi:MAG: hypothetical protein JO005_01240 [Gammaproteobacteria bacterium]|nr:hypothetical protein [Gammaproteobacteria bacterium]
MPALYGSYPMSREGSGTSWEPDATALPGLHQMGERWMTMEHGFATAVYDAQGGPRGASETFSTSMLMWMARRELPEGALGLRLMLSGDPAMGARGYPLLFQTGETADGRTPLIDRQHPHDLLMEAALSYQHALGVARSLFVYAGLPGEPALGPDAFVHRASAQDNPEAPLAHHWLDSTHITWGVATLGYVDGPVKLEMSGFNGREPDQHRADVETRGFDSWSVRLAVNPTPLWSAQVSVGRLASPEQLAPQVSVRRSTASVTYAAPLGLECSSMLAFGHNAPSQGAGSDAWLLESSLRLAPRLTVFARLETVGKDELFAPPDPAAAQLFHVTKLSAGYVFDFARLGELRLGLGALLSAYRASAALDPAYGAHPHSSMVFLRVRL